MAMNENIGVKGGKQDRKRCFIIKKRNLEKLKNSQKKEEKIIKRRDLKTFFKIIPLVIVGESFKVLFAKDQEKKNTNTIYSINPNPNLNYQEKKDNIKKNFSQKTPPLVKEKFSTPTMEKENIEKQIVIHKKKTPLPITAEKKINQDNTNKKNESITTSILPIKQIKKKNEYKKEKEKTIIPTFIIPSSHISNVKRQITKKENIPYSHNNIINFQKKDRTSKPKNDPNKETEKINNLTENKKWNNLKENKIIEEYERRLKEIRYSLRNLIYDYDEIIKEHDNVYTSQEAQILLDKLNIIIRKIEELKEKIKVEDIDKYDDAYIYQLVNDYIKEFDNQKFIDEIKDSELYIAISEKLQELDTEKNNLETNLEIRKEKMLVNEENFDQIKKDYDNYAKFDEEILKFQNEQLYLLKELEYNIENSLSIQEKVEIEIVAMNKQCKKLLQLIALQMMIPKLKSSKNIISATMKYMYFMRKILAPETRKQEYKIIQIEDYSKDIENSLYQLDHVNQKLQTTSKKLTTMIKEIEYKYREYLEAIPECKDLLNNLKIVESNLKEKEYELEKLKKQQTKNLEINNEKVKKLNNKIEKKAS